MTLAEIAKAKDRAERLAKMIGSEYWLNRCNGSKAKPSWFKVKVLRTVSEGELLQVFDSERGEYPVDPKDLKEKWQLNYRQRREIEAMGWTP